MRSKIGGTTRKRLLFSLMSLPIFTFSCVRMEVPVVETYYEAEYRTEYYSVEQDVPTYIQVEGNLYCVEKNGSDGMELLAFLRTISMGSMGTAGL